LDRGFLAASAVILNLAIWFALHVVFEQVREDHVVAMRLLVPVWDTLQLPSLALAAAALIAMLKFRVGMVPTLAASALLGVAYYLATGGT